MSSPKNAVLFGYFALDLLFNFTTIIIIVIKKHHKTTMPPSGQNWHQERQKLPIESNIK